MRLRCVLLTMNVKVISLLALIARTAQDNFTTPFRECVAPMADTLALSFPYDLRSPES